MARVPAALRQIVRSAAYVFACALFAAPALAGLRDYPMRVEPVRSGGAVELMAHNEGPGTMTVHMTIEAQNIASDVVWPVTKLVRPYSSLSFGKIFREDPKKPISLGWSISLQYGDFTATHANVSYRLPYPEGSRYYIVQSYPGPLTSHLGHESQHAVDFAMPEGTPVVAARDGVVIDVTMQYEEGGLYQHLIGKANVVVIQHEDGTVAHYAHLAKRDSPVKTGQRVVAGATIGYSGNTGYSSGPHLHFAVTKPETLADGRVSHVSLPVRFYVDTASLPFEPRRGALVTASYSRDPGMRVSTALPADSALSSAAAEAPKVSVIPVKSVPVPGAPRPMPEEAAAPPAAEPVRVVYIDDVATAPASPMGVSHATHVSAPAQGPATAARPARAPQQRPAADDSWSALEIAIVGLLGILVLLFCVRYVLQTRVVRSFTGY